MESLFKSERTMDEHLVIDHVSNSCSISSTSSINGDDDEGEEVNSSSPLQDMSSLLLQLPLKRGLSKHYNGKSQSFTSLSDVKCVEDVVKPENPLNKKLKTCKSYGRGFARKRTSSISNTMGSHLFSPFNGKRRNNSTFLNKNKPPIPPPHRSTSSLIF